MPPIAQRKRNGGFCRGIRDLSGEFWVHTWYCGMSIGGTAVLSGNENALGFSPGVFDIFPYTTSSSRFSQPTLPSTLNPEFSGTVPQLDTYPAIAFAMLSLYAQG